MIIQKQVEKYYTICHDQFLQIFTVCISNVILHCPKDMVETLRTVFHFPSTAVFYSEVNLRSAHLNLEAAFLKNKSVLNLKCMLELVFSLVCLFV